MKLNKKNQVTAFSLKLVKKVLLVIVLIFIFDLILFPAPVLAAEDPENIQNQVEFEQIELIVNEDGLTAEEVAFQANFNNNLPENQIWEAERYTYRTISAYTSEASQCDGAPCITANGFNLCEYGIEDSVAANWLPFGAKIRIPELYGDKVFVVRDRMNARYGDRVDIWFKDKQVAKQFGLKVAKIEVLE